jgi:hypothetical protein
LIPSWPLLLFTFMSHHYNHYYHNHYQHHHFRSRFHKWVRTWNIFIQIALLVDFHWSTKKGVTGYKT